MSKPLNYNKQYTEEDRKAVIKLAKEGKFKASHIKSLLKRDDSAVDYAAAWLGKELTTMVNQVEDLKNQLKQPDHIKDKKAWDELSEDVENVCNNFQLAVEEQERLKAALAFTLTNDIKVKHIAEHKVKVSEEAYEKGIISKTTFEFIVDFAIQVMNPHKVVPTEQLCNSLEERIAKNPDNKNELEEMLNCVYHLDEEAEQIQAEINSILEEKRKAS